MSGSSLRCSVLAGALACLSLLAAGCGGSKSPSIANVATTTSTVSSNTTPTASSTLADELAYARCMRAHGVPNFPDPNASGGFQFSAGTDTSSPAFQAAQAKCQKQMPGGGFPAPGTATHPSPQALAQILKESECMRRHGISGFPDPTTTIPARSPGSVGVISDRDGVILVFPATLDMQSPAFLHAAAACGFALTNH